MSLRRCELSGRVSVFSRSSLSRQITRVSVLVAAVMLATLSGFGWWAATRIDSEALDRQARAIATGLEEVAERTVIEQDSSAIWDDSVINLRANNDAWLAE